MFVDAQLEFSDSQAITASAASTNIIDFNPAFDYNTVTMRVLASRLFWL